MCKKKRSRNLSLSPLLPTRKNKQRCDKSVGRTVQSVITSPKMAYSLLLEATHLFTVPVLNVDVSLPMFILACFAVLVGYQHLKADANISRVSSASKLSMSGSEPSTRSGKKAISAKKKATAKKRRAKTPRLSSAKEQAAKKKPARKPLSNEFVKVFKGAWGLRIERTKKGNVFVSGFVNKQVDKRIDRGMYVNRMNGVDIPLVHKIDDVVDLINMEKSKAKGSGVEVTFSSTPNYT